jgi:heat shock protein 5
MRPILYTHSLTICTAKNQYASNPERTVYDIKRLIGRKFNDKDVQRDMKHFPFKVVNKGGQPRVQVEVQE